MDDGTDVGNEAGRLDDERCETLALHERVAALKTTVPATNGVAPVRLCPLQEVAKVAFDESEGSPLFQRARTAGNVRAVIVVDVHNGAQRGAGDGKKVEKDKLHRLRLLL